LSATSPAEPRNPAPLDAPSQPGVRLRSVSETLPAPAVRVEALSLWLDRLAEHVVLFRAGGFVFVTFGLFAAVGVALSVGSMGVILIGQGVGIDRFLALALAGSASIVVGSWLLAQLLDYQLLLRSPSQALRRPVFVSWGGILPLPIVLALFSQAADGSALMLLDALARTILIGHVFGRLGCLTYGCCFGRPTSGRLAIRYRNPLSKAVRVGHVHDTPLHPAPLYEAAVDVGGALAVNLVALGGAPLGVPAALAMILYGLGRFAVEFYKDNAGRYVIGRIAINHVVCLVVAALGVALLARVLGQPVPAPPIDWARGLASVPALLRVLLPCALIVFLGFALHRRDVGTW
jgi:phosphatidylglycerol:prolipoprotein diacylglycerol transferase